MTQTISPDRLAAARQAVSRMLGLRPGHASEAIAASLGCNTHAALLAALHANERIARTPDALRFRTRLAELGHEPAAVDADASLAVSFGVVPKGASDRKATADLLRVSNFVASARMEIAVDQPAASEALLALRPIPDAKVPTMTIGKDTLRWNPSFVRSLMFEEMKFLLAAAALHRAAAHPLRLGGRDPDLWRVACDHVVSHFLVEARVGELPKCGFYNKLFPSSMPAEDVYEQLSRESPCFRGQSLFRFEAWKAKAPAMLPTVAEVAGGRLKRLPRHDALDMAGFDPLTWGFGPERRTIARMARNNAANGGRKDVKSTSFGRHLAKLVAGLPEHERAQVVSVALGQVSDAYRAARFDDLLKDVHPAPRG